MTPKEKAKELLDKYWIYLRAGLLYDDEAKDDAKQCALLAIDEVIQEICATSDKYFIIHRLAYWKEVKDEVEKLN